MKVQRLPLGATPRRVLFHSPSNSILALCTTTVGPHATSGIGAPTATFRSDTYAAGHNGGTAGTGGPGRASEEDTARAEVAQAAGLAGAGAPLVLPDARALLDSFPSPPHLATGLARGTPTGHGDDFVASTGINSTDVNSTSGGASGGAGGLVAPHPPLDQPFLRTIQSGPHQGDGLARGTPRSELCCLDPASGQRRASLLLPPGWQGLSLVTWEPREREKEREREGERGREAKSPAGSGAGGTSRTSAGQASGTPPAREPAGQGEKADQKGEGGPGAVSDGASSEGLLAAGAAKTEGTPQADPGSGEAQGSVDGMGTAAEAGETQGPRPGPATPCAVTAAATPSASEEGREGTPGVRRGKSLGSPGYTGGSGGSAGASGKRERERESGWRLVVVGAVERPLSLPHPLGREDTGGPTLDPLGVAEGSPEAHRGVPQADPETVAAREGSMGYAPGVHREHRARSFSGSLDPADGVPPFSGLPGTTMWQGAAAEWAGAGAGTPSGSTPASLADAGVDPDAPFR